MTPTNKTPTRTTEPAAGEQGAKPAEGGGPQTAGAERAQQERPLPENYEAARDELTAVVERLEAGGLSLDESLTWWERGQALAAACEKFLAGARERVETALAEAPAAADADPATDRAGGDDSTTP